MNDIFEALKTIVIQPGENQNLEDAAKTLFSAAEAVSKQSYKDFNTSFYHCLKIMDNQQKLFVYLSAYLASQHVLHKLTGIAVKPYIKHSKIDNRIALDDIFKVFSPLLIDENNSIRFFMDYNKFNLLVSDKVFYSVMDYLDEVLAEAEKVSDEDTMRGFITLFAIARIGGINFDTVEAAYACFQVFIEQVNFWGEPQHARNFIEEMMIASSHDSVFYCGLISKFVVATKQKLHFESAFLSLVIVILLENRGVIHELFYRFFLFSMVSLLRDINMQDEYVLSILHIIEHTFTLAQYDQYRIVHMRFSCIIFSPTGKQYCQELIDYLDREKASILFDNNIASRWWIPLLVQAGTIHTEYKEKFEHLIAYFKNGQDDETISHIMQTVGADDIIGSLHRQINMIYKGHNYRDIAMQMKSIRPIINATIDEAMQNQNIELLILAIFAKSHPVEIKPENSMEEFFKITHESFAQPNDVANAFRYQLSSFARNHPNIVLLDEHRDEVYAVIYDKGQWCLKREIESFESIKAWSGNNLGKISFCDSKRTRSNWYDFNDLWEDETREIMEVLPNVILSEVSPNDALFVLATTQMQLFPSSLIRMSKDDFFASTTPVSTIFSSSIFYSQEEKNALVKIKATVFSLDKNDYTVISGTDKMVEALNEVRGSIDQIKTDESLGDIITSAKQLNISFIIGHGGRDDDKFRAVSLEGNEYFLSNEMATSNNDDIVVLFICHAGFSSAKEFCTDVYSLANEFLRRGARHVIAPSWKLNTLLVGPWSKAFMEYLLQTCSPSLACFYANMEIRKQFKSLAAWACLQHYGG